MLSRFTSHLRALPTLATTKPVELFWSFVALHLVLWTWLTDISSPNAPLDVIEGYAWGREWLLGTYKHPPMQAWILEIMATLTGRASVAHFLASQLSVVIAFWAVWQTGRRIMGEAQALIGVLLLEGVIYYNFTSPEFNPNVLQLCFWALAGWSFHRAVRDNRLIDWILLGVWAAGGMYTKYSTALLLGVFVVLVIARPEARRCLKKPGPYLAVGVALLLFLPHVMWLMQHDFLPITYVKDRLQVNEPATRYLKHPPEFFPTFLLSPIVFIVAQILALLPACILFLALDKAPRGAHFKKIDNFDRTFLFSITFVPMILTLAMAIGYGFKIHDMWGAPFFNFVGLWAVAKFYPEGARMRPRFFITWAIIFFAGLLGCAGNNLLSPYITLKPMRVHFAGKAMSRQIEEVWHERFHRPLKYAIGNTWGAGNIAYYARERPHLFINADPEISTWIDEADVKKEGGVIVWCIDNCVSGNVNRMPEFVPKKYPQAEIQPNLEIRRQTEADIAPVIIGWAIVPPTL